jgi:hypothetical protein
MGKWRSYLAYYTTTLVAEGNNQVFAVANGSLYSYGKDDNSVRYFSKENGLSDNQITSIGYNAGANVLVTVYSNGNIDLIGEDNSVYNLPYLMQSTNIQDKTVNGVFCVNEMAYLPANFGIIVINVRKKEIKETYILNEAVSAVTIHNDAIYAVTANGLRRASLNDNLINPANWHAFAVATPDAKDVIQQVCTFQHTLCFLLKGKGVYYLTENNTVQLLLALTSIRNMKVVNDKLVAFSSSEIYIYSTLTERDKGSLANISDVSSLKDNTTFWLAIGEGGLTGIKRTAANQYQTLVSDIRNDGPKRNLTFFLRMHKQKLYITGGGRWTDRFFNTGTIMIYDTDSLKWNNLKDTGTDVTSLAVDPDDDTHLFISTWGEGIYELKAGQVVNHYNHTNSTLGTIPGTGQPNNYVRVEGLCYDKQHNLWMTNSGVNDVIHVLKADGTWTKLYYDDISNPHLADKILIASNGHKWLNLARANKSGIFVFDDKGTLEDTSDDSYHYYSFLSNAQGNIGTSEYFCITEDKKGEIWIGTNRGVVFVSVPSRGVEGTMTCSRIEYTDEYGLPDYFLKDERIRAIAVDGGNRKWLGTENSGIYLVSEDGSQVISHFTVDNSPLLSNTIQSIAINDATGEVFMGTDKGLISYLGDATQGSEDYSDVYAYPNPVRPDFDDKVVITGLMENSNVKITDARGSLVFEGRSTGGRISWDFRNRSGRPVAAGVYLVLSSTPGAGESVVTKIAVIR